MLYYCLKVLSIGLRTACVESLRCFACPSSCNTTAAVSRHGPGKRNPSCTPSHSCRSFRRSKCTDLICRDVWMERLSPCSQERVLWTFMHQERSFSSLHSPSWLWAPCTGSASHRWWKFCPLCPATPPLSRFLGRQIRSHWYFMGLARAPIWSHWRANWAAHTHK